MSKKTKPKAVEFRLRERMAAEVLRKMGTGVQDLSTATCARSIAFQQFPIMHATNPRTDWQRLEHWLIWIAAIATLLFLLVPVAGDRLTSHTDTSLKREAPTLHKVELPFTTRQVVDYFSTVLEKSVERKPGGRFVFENQHGTVPEDFWQIEIWPEADSVVVQFTMGGDYGMSLAREFFECPLFEPAETDRLYLMLNEAQNSPVAKLHRFTVNMTYREQSQLQMLNLKFAPPAVPAKT